MRPLTPQRSKMHYLPDRPRSGKLACFASLIETCELNSIRSQDYIADALHQTIRRCYEN